MLSRMEPQTNVDGYMRCRSILCQTLVPVTVYYLTNRLCMDCFLAGPGAIVIDVEIAAGRHSTAVLTKGVWPPKKRTEKRSNHKTAKYLADKRAQTRLAKMFPAEYQILLTDERLKAGLLPPPLRPGAVGFTETLKTYQPPEMYDLARNPGEPPDGA